MEKIKCIKALFISLISKAKYLLTWFWLFFFKSSYSFGIISLFFFIPFFADGQDLHNDAFYLYDLSEQNPAYIGAKGKMHVFSKLYRYRTGFESSPEMNVIGIHSPLALHTNLGFQINHQVEGLVQNFSGQLSYAYSLQISRFQFLRLGLSVYAQQNFMQQNQIIAEDITEMIQIIDDSYSVFRYGGNAGLVYRLADFQLAVDFPKFYSSNSSLDINPRVFSSYRFYLSQKIISLEPSVLFFYRKNANDLFDVSLLASYLDLYQMSFSYRNSQSLVGTAGISFGNYAIYYSYQHSIDKIARNLNPVHGVSLAYTFGKNKIKLPVTNLQSPLFVENMDTQHDSSQLIVHTPIITADSLLSYDEWYRDTDSVLLVENTYYEPFTEDTISVDESVEEPIWSEDEAEEIKKQAENYTLIEVADGIYELEIIDSALVDSTLFDKVVEQKMQEIMIEEEQKEIKGDYYTIQVLALLQNRKDILSFGDLASGLEEFEVDGMYKYTFGRYESIAEAQGDLRTIINLGHSGAFVQKLSELKK